jgi:phosphoribosylformylglycinamidine (FGAM) synthase-like amidotransferase family enzyme
MGLLRSRMPSISFVGGLIFGAMVGYSAVATLQIPIFSWGSDRSKLKQAELRRDQRIVFRYSNAGGEVTAESNPNGSLDNIAGICSPGRNVLGMMPHPERSAEPELGGTDGFKVFQSLVGAMASR